jgi:hypothetical protein
MGTVWKATDTLLRRDVAVKEVILPPQMPSVEKDALCERTMREARAAAALSHPSVVQVYDVVTDGGRPWIVMELLDARSLADMVIDDGPLSGRAVAKIGVAMLGALEVAHAAGVLHRDVKPANVLICADGRCVLTDFGVARLPTESNLTTPGMVLGSPHFISPERAVGGNFGPPSDLFSLGVTLYTAVEGGPPFDRGDPFETMRAVVEENPRPARLAGPLQPVLMGLLEKEPARRWSVDQARAALRELLTGALGRRARHDTDVHAVIRPPAGPPPALREPSPRGGRQVGGRAMLDPDEPLTGQLARLRASQGGTGSSAATTAGAGGPGGGAVGLGPAVDDLWADQEDPSAAIIVPPRTPRGGAGRGATAYPGGYDDGFPGGAPDAGPADDGFAAHGVPGGPGHGAPAGLAGPAGPGADGFGRGGYGGPDPRPGPVPLGGSDEWESAPRREGAGRRRAPSTGSVVAGQVKGRVKELGRPANRSRLLIGVGVLVLAVLVGVAALNGVFSGSGGDEPGAQPGASTGTSASAAAPLIPVQQYRDKRGLVVNVPKDWEKSGSSYVDFVDPAGGRKVRINVETANGTAQHFFQTAESGLKRPSICPTPYHRVGLRDAQLAGRDGAELEYTCGSGDQMRHGIWRAIVVDGKAYHFYLTVPDAQFAASKVIYDEMVRSFQLV